MFTKTGRIMGESWDGALESSGNLTEESAKRLLGPVARRKAQEPATPWRKALGYGAGIGGGIGGVVGGISGGRSGLLSGGALGALLGLAGGTVAKAKDDMQTEDASEYLSENEEAQLQRRAQVMDLLQRRQAERIGTSVGSNMPPTRDNEW